MNIAELINAVGIDDTRIQFLDQCADSLDYSAKRGTKITFGTQEPITPEGTNRMGIVVWLPRGKVNELIAKERAEKSA